MVELIISSSVPDNSSVKAAFDVISPPTKDRRNRGRENRKGEEELLYDITYNRHHSRRSRFTFHPSSSARRSPSTPTRSEPPSRRMLEFSLRWTQRQGPNRREGELNLCDFGFGSVLPSLANDIPSYSDSISFRPDETMDKKTNGTAQATKNGSAHSLALALDWVGGWEGEKGEEGRGFKLSTCAGRVAFFPGSVPCAGKRNADAVLACLVVGLGGSWCSLALAPPRLVPSTEQWDIDSLR